MVGIYMSLGSNETGQPRSQQRLPFKSISCSASRWRYDMLHGCCTQETLRQCVVMGRVWNWKAYVCKAI